MKTNAWLTINRRGAMRMTKGQPGLNWDEVSIKLEVDLPDDLFKRPRLQANIKIPQEAAQPQDISAETIEDCKDAIKTATGLEMHITVVKDEEEKE